MLSLKRPAILMIAIAGLAAAQPALTTVQDTLYRADGSRFTGTLFITWSSFQSGGGSNIATSNLTLPIVNGILKVQLVPTTTASAGAQYDVRYNSRGINQFTEVWAVPPSSVTLRVRDVRVSQGALVGPPPVVAAVQIPDVVGLANELALRPLKGVGFGIGRTAVINQAGQLDAATGNLSDCVLVDGSSGPCGSGSGGINGSTVNSTGTVITMSPGVCQLPSGTVVAYASSATVTVNSGTDSVTITAGYDSSCIRTIWRSAAVSGSYTIVGFAGSAFVFPTPAAGIFIGGAVIETSGAFGAATSRPDAAVPTLTSWGPGLSSCAGTNCGQLDPTVPPTYTVGTAIASASTIAPAAPITHITGTTAITTITAPAAFASGGQGGCLILVADGAWTISAAGNVAVAVTPATGNQVNLCYDNATAKWYVPQVGSTYTGLTLQTFTSSGTFTPGTGVVLVFVEVWGPGAGGSGANSSGGAAGGSGGGYASGWCAVTPSVGVAVTVGTGGAGGTAGAGSAGSGPTSFDMCITATAGGANGGINGAGTPGFNSATTNMPFGVRADNLNHALWTANPSNLDGFWPLRDDIGGQGASGRTTSGIGFTGASTIHSGGGGGGGGTNAGNAGGAGGLSAYGGKGGNGGAGNNGAACTPGTAPGGGGGGSVENTTGAATGCAGARGEVRVRF